jgi:hypothetical protein
MMVEENSLCVLGSFLPSTNTEDEQHISEVIEVDKGHTSKLSDAISQPTEANRKKPKRRAAEERVITQSKETSEDPLPIKKRKTDQKNIKEIRGREYLNK